MKPIKIERPTGDLFSMLLHRGQRHNVSTIGNGKDVPLCDFSDDDNFQVNIFGQTITYQVRVQSNYFT